ncbi:hypothetical protein Tco_0606642, partial [Tanacetum coccineum]
PHKGVKASANSDVMYSFTSAQDGDPLQDDVRLCLGNDLKKAQDHRVTSLRGRLLDIRKRLGHDVMKDTTYTCYDVMKDLIKINVCAMNLKRKAQDHSSRDKRKDILKMEKEMEIRSSSNIK